MGEDELWPRQRRDPRKLVKGPKHKLPLRFVALQHIQRLGQGRQATRPEFIQRETEPGSADQEGFKGSGLRNAQALSLPQAVLTRRRKRGAF